MLDIKFIRQNVKTIEDNCVNRNIEFDLSKLLALADKKKETQTKIETLRAERKKTSKTKPSEKEIVEMKKVGTKLNDLEVEFNQIEAAFSILMQQVPNVTHPDCPIGKDEADNIVVRSFKKPEGFNFPAKDHLALGEALGIIDTKIATKISGTRFNYLFGGLAVLEFALIQHAISILTNEEILTTIIKNNKLNVTNKAFIPVVPPVMIKPEVMQKMGRLEPRAERYHISDDDLYLIGSAEHALGPIHMETTFQENQLPVRYLGFSTAFRREAGSYGKDTRGILRVHQFDKLEIESFTTSDRGLDEQNFIIAIQEYLMQSLDLPYQIVFKCTGDMGLPDFREFDVETWLPGQNRYRETHTSDYMTDYQSRRLEIKVKKNNGEIEFVHMNDATVFAIGRTLIAIMENYQQADGSIIVPEALRKYTSFDVIKLN